MTDRAPSASAPPTPLASLMAPDGNFELTETYGALTPVRYTNLAAELDGLLHGAVFYDLGWLSRVGVRGEDRFRWLSGMVTNVVNELASGAGAWSFVLNAQGRILGDLNVWREGDRLELELEGRQLSKLLEHLERFIIMDDVELSPQYGVTALGFTGPKVLDLLKTQGIFPPEGPMRSRRVVCGGVEFLLEQGPSATVPHYTLWMPTPTLAVFLPDLLKAGAVPVGAEAVEALRVAEGRPVYGTDIAERDLPQETSQSQVLNFDKGCYQGQEIVERIRSRGNVHRHLRLLELTGPLPTAGSELQAADGKAAGTITSAACLPLANGPRSFALAMIAAAAEVRNQPLTYQDGAGMGRLLTAPFALGQKTIG